MLYRKQRGLTLLETMITVAIVGIIATVSFYSYQSYVRKAKRSDAIQTLASMQMAEERYRTQNTSYGTLAQVWGGTSTTPNGEYNLVISNLSGTSYTLTATATGDQANDAANGTSCTTLTLAVNNGADTRTPAACWN